MKRLSMLLALSSLAFGCTESEQGSGSPGGIPCAVQTVIAKHCSSCHGDKPAFGAPMSLASRADFLAKAQNGAVMHKRVAERISDLESPMPPPDQAPMTAAEQNALEGWLAEGAPRSTESCDGAAEVPVAVPNLDDVDLSECETVTEMRAFKGADGADEQPFDVPLEDDHYECFYFIVPWTDKRQAFRIDPIIDDTRVVHHWLLYSSPSGVAGTHSSCVGIHPDATLVSGWAPGGPSQVLPEDVGMQMPDGGTFLLEVHYNNVARHADAKDRSGVRLCSSTKLRKNEAATHTLGMELFALAPSKKSDVSGTCTVPAESTILSMSPHMHQLGRRMRTIVEREDGTKETVFDRGFDFSDQRVYQLDEPLKVGPGDRIRTTCTFDNASNKLVPFGESTDSEMCFNFVLAYPPGSLVTGGFVGGVNRCLR
jgi:hypothetical protein